MRALTALVIVLFQNFTTVRNLPKSCHQVAQLSNLLRMNAKLSPQRFWPCHENWLIKTIQMIHNLLICVFQVSLPLLWIRVNQDNP